MKYIPFILGLLLLLSSCSPNLSGKAYSSLDSEKEIISMLQNNCVVAESGDESKITSCNEMCHKVVVLNSDVQPECVLGMVYRNDGSYDKSTFYLCNAEFNPSRNSDGSLDSYLDCYCCSP